MNARVLMRVAAAAGGLILSASVGRAAEVKVFTSVALTTALNEISPIFEQKTGHKLVIDFNLAAVQKKRLLDSDRADVIILTRSMMEDLAKQNKLAPGNLVNVAGTPVALAAACRSRISQRSKRSSKRCFQPIRSPTPIRPRAA